jgi:uncharacterized protein (DUF58 family)
MPLSPFDTDFVRTLEYLSLVARRVLAGQERAEHRTFRRGGVIEFADHRSYAPGDDLKYVDWNVYARSGNLFVKEYAAEENVHLLVLVDRSASMDFGQVSKFLYARQLAAVLAYIGLSHYDAVSVFAFDRDLLPLQVKLRGKRRIFDLLRSLAELAPGKETSLVDALAGAFPAFRGKTLVVVLSDFYDRLGLERALLRLRARDLRPHAIHLVDPSEVAPAARGRIEIRDLETGEREVLTVDDALLGRYQQAMARHLERVERFCLRSEIGYTRLLTTTSLERAVVELLRSGRLIRAK